MTQVEESIEIAVPLSVAYNQWTQFEDFPLFMSSVERIEQRSPDLTHWVVRVGGTTREFDARITEQIPDERVAWTTVSGDLHQAGVVTFHRLDEGRTKVMLQLAHKPHGLVETVGDWLGFIHRQTTDDLRHFKDYIESRAAETGAWRGQI
ncbi:SRPBCC family protein [Kitasatospora sp. NPDC049285]|uniref:SRPBCC family protein n=1 Tax=Kitasatospora sp. NPDC049285 TaxID=3157096 RepID=UPI0034140B0E